MNKFEVFKKQQDAINIRHVKAVKEYFEACHETRDKMDEAIKAFEPVYLFAMHMNSLPSATEQDRLRYIDRRDHMNWILEQRKNVDRFNQELYSAIYNSI